MDAERCPGCGQTRAECMSAGADDAYTVEAIRCHGCAAKARKAAKFSDSPEGMFYLVRRDE